MAGNTIGHIFRVTTFGESHGPAIGGVIDGFPPGFKLSERDLQFDLNRRRPGSSNYVSKRFELDRIKILSGVFRGVTTGTSIGLIIKNSNYRTADYNIVKNLYRPGHADYTYEKKYGLRDYRGGGRASARETAIRVAAGAVAKKYLSEKYKIEIRGFLSQLGNIKCKFKSWRHVRKNQFSCPDLSYVKVLDNLIKNLKRKGDSIGAKITIIANNVPIGLGEPVFDRINADLAHALMSINAAKGIEIGDGFEFINKYGSNSRDEITPSGFLSNHDGGILGGISNGQNIIVHLAFKPTSSVRSSIYTINKEKKIKKIKIYGRHDPCIGIRAIPIAEAMMAIVFMDHLLRYRAQCMDIINKIYDKNMP